MRPISQRFQDAVRYPHAVVSTCDVTFPDGTTFVVPIEGGEITIDRTAIIRRTGGVRIPWTLDSDYDVRNLAFGGYATVRRGVRFGDETVELVDLGRLRVESVSWRLSEGTANLELADRMAQVRDEQFLAPYTPTVLAPVTRTGTLHDDSPVVTIDTTGLIVGMAVAGMGIPAGTRVKSIDSATQLTLTTPANIAGVKDGYVLGNSDRLWVQTTADLFVGMRVDSQSGWLVNDTLREILSAQQVRVYKYWSPGDAFPDRFTFSIPAAQSLTFAGAIRVADAAIEITQGVFGDTIAYQKIIDPAVVLGDTFYEGDRTEALANLQIAGGAEIYFDALGNFVFDAPAGTSPVMWTVNAGDEGVLVDAGESLDRTGVYNGVLVQGQQYAAQPPVAALVVDSDASSPTRWGGPFGKVARLETSTVVQTTQQAVDAANALLDVRLGLTRSLTLAAAPNPALEAGDVIRVDFGDGRIEQHVIDAVRTGLGAADGQELSTRSVFVPALDAQIPLPDRRRALFGNEAWRELRQAKRVSVAA